MAKGKKEKTSIEGQEPAFLAQYRKAYPRNSKFYVTSDNMVFLETDYDLAVLHQRSCKDGELKTY